MPGIGDDAGAGDCAGAGAVGLDLRDADRFFPVFFALVFLPELFFAAFRFLRAGIARLVFLVLDFVFDFDFFRFFAMIVLRSLLAQFSMRLGRLHPDATQQRYKTKFSTTTISKPLVASLLL